MNKISAVYKITNTITNDFYIGSSNDVKRRFTEHKKPSTWKRFSNNQLYKDMKNYGIDKFEFEILAEVEPEQLKETEQQFIEKLQPAYNQINAKGLNIEKRKEYQKSDKYKEYEKEYRKTDKYKEYQKEYEKSEKRKEYKKSDKYKESRRKAQNKYNKSDKRKKVSNKYQNQLCCYNGETLTLHALASRFRRRGLSNPTAEAKKYLV